ncbi:hypothetical protein DO97_05500 [Neosynechococcus sphagnicola sy1]|uniref:Inner membrane protein YqiJ N-terminal domain-containing protein n=1 Tax=Neosynechococcus sphagnicola sy1 TaxID=1497020 RepID=A0A098TKB7_9CYAN|nr:OB-fold-containig protein [Neosynechococcus sphagnicola]KGF72775.1 hypothetical protein DO97_05500 [Neosynechococcus sphagnicola sy1]
MLFDLANLPYWMLLLLGVLLFVFVIALGGSDDSLHTHVEGDFPDLEADADAGFGFSDLLGWLGVGKAPLVLLLAVDLSLWGVVGWMLNSSLGSLGGTMPEGLGAIAVMLSALGVALYLGRWAARPLEKIFASFGEDASSDRLVGCVGIVSSAMIPPYQTGRIGQVNVVDSARNRVIINAALPDWATVTAKLGVPVLVIDRQDQIYLVIVQGSVDQDHWLNHSSHG